MSDFEYGNGFIVAIAHSEKALEELRSEEKNVLYKDDKGYIFLPSEYRLSKIEDSAKEMLDGLNEFDVVEFFADNNFRILYSSVSNDNALFITNKCNSNCIMCPCSEHFRQKPCNETVEHLCKIAEYIPSDTRFLTITGGEPTLLFTDMFQLLLTLRNHFEGTKFFLLTNGRSLSDKTFLKGFLENMPCNMRFAIPLYGYDSATHDHITQAQGSFDQTVKGLKNLISAHCEIEIRIVVSKLNYKHMDKLADFIVKELQGINCVHIMATEMMGAAAKNRADVWLDYADAFDSSKYAIKTLIKNGIDVELYNFPLCKVEKGYWPLCAKSISDYKIRYGESCEKCEVKSLCGGVFRSTLLLTKMKLEPIAGV